MPESRARAQVTCSHCGGDEFVDGRLSGYPGFPIRFVPTWKRWFRNSPKVEASACRACGRLSLWVGPDELRQVVGK